MRRHSSAREEDYLEAILTLAARRRSVRPSDVATLLGVRRPSVSTALRRLASKGWIHHRTYGDVRLTTAGYQRARAVAAGHRTLREFLTLALGCSPRTADRMACAMEHSVPPRVTARLGRLLEVLRAHPAIIHQIRNGTPPRAREASS
jgi:DtxR family Mn-dependent transcriptional regulator